MVERSRKGTDSARSVFTGPSSATTVRHSPDQEKAGPISTYSRCGPACFLVFTEPHQTAAISACDRPRTRLGVSQLRYHVSAQAYFFFLPVFFFAFFAFFAFLAMLPSATPKLLQRKSTSTCINIEYTTIAKLTDHASKKVNGGHTKRPSARRRSLTLRRRDEHGLCSAGSRA